MSKIGLKSFKIQEPIELKVECDSFDPWSYFYKRHLGIDYFWCKEKEMKRLPKRYIINKGATILFWDQDGDDKTIVKLSDNDKFDKRLQALLKIVGLVAFIFCRLTINSYLCWI